MNAITPAQPVSIEAQPVMSYTLIVNATLATVAKSSARIYADTYSQWAAWAAGAGVHPLDFVIHVEKFLCSVKGGKSTRQRMLSAMRRLAQMAFVLTGDDMAQRAWQYLKVLKAPACDTADAPPQRSGRALAPSDADRVLRAWQAAPARPADQPRYLRNAALIAVLILSGLRRSEAAALRWADIDFENGTLAIRHGKGDKARQAAFSGDMATDALLRWRAAQPAGFLHVFTPCGRGAHMPADKPITGGEVYRVIRATEAMTGIEFRPHDLRRTFITEAIQVGADLRTVQTLAGHARPETTLGYAQAVDARRARGELRFRFG